MGKLHERKSPHNPHTVQNKNRSTRQGNKFVKLLLETRLEQSSNNLGKNRARGVDLVWEVGVDGLAAMELVGVPVVAILLVGVIHGTAANRTNE